MLSDKQINDAKNRAPLQLEGHFEHNDCIRMAYEWLDAQVKTKTRRKTFNPIKHIIEKWSGRYVSQSDVEVAAWLHPDITGTYPNFNISSRLTFPWIGRLSNISEAGKHNPIGRHYNESTYSIEEDPQEDLKFEENVQKVVNWFHSNYQDPANRLPYNGREGGYLYTHGGPYNAAVEISDEFSEIFPESLIDEAVKRVEIDGIFDWDSTDTYYEDIEPDSVEPTDIFKVGPKFDVGVNLDIRDGKIVRFANLVDQDLGIINVLKTLHDGLRSTSQSILLNHKSIGNKYKTVLDALIQYHQTVDADLNKLDITTLYSEGLNLETEYKMALHYAGDELEEYPEFSRAERTALELLMRRHAVFINSTPDGAALVEAELRYQRSGDEELELIQQSLVASKVLLERPDIIDPEVANLISDNVSPSSSDPNANRKKTLARTTLKIVNGGVKVGHCSGGILPSRAV